MRLVLTDIFPEGSTVWKIRLSPQSSIPTSECQADIGERRASFNIHCKLDSAVI